MFGKTTTVSSDAVSPMFAQMTYSHQLIKDVDRTFNFLAKTLINREDIIRTQPHQASLVWRCRCCRALKVIKERMIDRQSDRECAARHSLASFISFTHKLNVSRITRIMELNEKLRTPLLCSIDLSGFVLCRLFGDRRLFLPSTLPSIPVTLSRIYNPKVV